MVSEKSVVCLGRAELGAGQPVVCIPVMGADIQTLAARAHDAMQARADVIELRIDSLSPMPTAAQAITACQAVRDASNNTPLLFTLRTTRDGGPGSDDAAAYEKLLCKVAAANVCDAVDCELSAGDAVFTRIVSTAHAHGIIIIGSSHAFTPLPDQKIAADWLLRQQALGADICKAAVMTENPLRALSAMAVLAEAGQALSVPYIAIVMGADGLLTRIGCECIGSCLTFGTAGEASAPGQIDARKLRQILEIVHDSLHK